MPALSVFVTTYNNARTLPACLESLKWADEVLVLDSYSTDATVEIAQSYGCVVHQHAFLGYGRQKQLALDKTRYDWVLFLDADEALSEALCLEIQSLLVREPPADAYLIARQEQLFWRMCSPATAMNHYLRLFNKHKTHFSNMPVHAAPHTTGSTEKLKAAFYHFGEPDLHTKVAKINAYSSGLVQDKLSTGRTPGNWILLIYPPWFFFRLYLLKRNYLNGWGGFMTSVCGAFYVFLKYAKVYEYRQFDCYGDSQFPVGSPPHPRVEKNSFTPPV